MIRLLIFAAVIYFGYRLLKPLIVSLLKSGDGESRDDLSAGETELIQDPQCGTYFLKQRGVAARIRGRTVHFCSEACRESYLKSRQSA